MSKRMRVLMAVASIVPILFLHACAASLYRAATGDALVLTNGTEIPGEILEIDETYIYFRAETVRDRYTYGEKLPVGEIKLIKVVESGRTEYLTVDAYIDKYGFTEESDSEPYFAEANAPAEPAGESGRNELQSSVLQEEFSKFNVVENPAPPAFLTATARQKKIGPGLRLQRLPSDSLLKSAGKSGIGLKLPASMFESLSELNEAAFAEAADLIIASGAAGLVLYRAQKLEAEGYRISAGQRRLINAIRASEFWKTRKNSILAAHSVAKEAYSDKYRQIGDFIERELGFKFREAGADVNKFLFFLHTHGDLRAARRRQLMYDWFGETATSAMKDLLANFDDWYYLVVLRGKEEAF